MSLRFFSFIYFLSIIFPILPTTHAIPTNIQTLESNDIETLPDLFPSIIDKLQETISRFRCPKGWKRLGGSCYYYSNVTSASSHVNYTCNYIHSNHSNLIQIRNAVELFYAAHVLSRNNLTSLMIEIHSSLLKGKKVADILLKDNDRWERMKNLFPEVRLKYQRLKKIILDRLSSAGLRITQRGAKKSKPKQDLIHDEYEYDDLDSPDEIDEFEEIQDLRGICDDIHWNVLNDRNNTTVYILTTYNILDKTICSLSEVEPETKYHYICEYVLDFCFANILCGKHGHCINTLSGFKCGCSILYGGLFCERITQQGIQLIIASLIIIILGVLNSCLILYIVKSLSRAIKKRCKKAEKHKDESETSTNLLNSGQTDSKITIINNQELRSTSSLPTSIKFDIIRNILVGFLSITILIILYSMILLRYYKLFKINSSGIIDSKYLLNTTIHLVKECTSLSNYRISSLILAPCALLLTLVFYILIKIQKPCSGICNSQRFPPPIQPFSIVNRVTTATVFGILAFEVLKIFEELLFSLDDAAKPGVIVELLIRIGTIAIVGLQYYPMLVSLHSNNIVVRFLICIYIVCIVIYTIIREGSCMGYLPLSGKHRIGEEAKLRMELGTWFILYGLLKNTPHFFFLSYITAELCVRFAYDSICIRLKDQQNMESISEKPNDDVPIPHREKSSKQKQDLPQINIQQNRVKRSCIKKCLDLIYIWNDDFHFTTMVICTYTVAVVFLYYLGCTFVFLYISRTTGHIAFVKSYIESSANIQLPATPFKPEIIISAVVTVIIYVVQLFLGIKQYKIDRTELKNRNTEHRIPQIDYFDKDLIASNSVHYPGFLIGYLAWGFVFCSHLILAILIGIRIIYLNVRYATLILGIIVPILMLYLLKSVSMRKVGDSFLIRRDKRDDKCTVKHQRTYAVFIYFMFFADCYLGIASCIIRLLMAALVNLLFMARLDYSSLGRPLDKYDDGYAAYVSFLYMELNHTHPEKHDAVNENPGASCNKRCCTTAIDDDVRTRNETNDESMQNITHHASQSKTIRGLKTSSRLREPESMSNINTTATKTKSSIPETMSRATTDKDTQNSDDKKSTKQTSNIPNGQVKADKNDSPSTSQISSPPQQQSTSVVKQTIPQKLQPKTNNLTDDDDDDDGGINMKKLIKQRQKKEAKQAKKDELKKKKQLTKIDDSTDGEEEQHEAMSKRKNKELKTKKKSLFTKCFQDHQNDNDAVSKQKKLDDKNKKQILKDEDEDEDEDGGPIVKTYSTIKMMMSSKKPVLNNLTTKDESSNGASDDSTIQSSKHKKDTISTSVDNQNPKTNDEIQIVEEPAAQTITTDSSPSTHQKSYENKVYLLRTTSYLQAQQRSPPIVSQRLLNTNVHENHYSEIKDDANRLSKNDCLHLIIKTMRALSNYTSEPQTLTNESDRKIHKRQKIARTRWHLAYTLINNSSLFEGRKKVLEKKRLFELSQQQTSEPTTTNKKSVFNTDNTKSGTLRSRRMKAKTTGSLNPQSPEDLLFLPMPDIDEESHDLVRNPIPIQLPPINNTNTQQTKTTSNNKSTQQKNAKLPTTHHKYINTRDTKKVKNVV